jgi:hypothetical protein
VSQDDALNDDSRAPPEFELQIILMAYLAKDNLYLDIKQTKKINWNGGWLKVIWTHACNGISASSASYRSGVRLGATEKERHQDLSSLHIIILITLPTRWRLARYTMI